MKKRSDVAPESAVEIVSGVRLDRVSEAAVGVYLRRSRLGKGGTLAERVRRLAEHQAKLGSDRLGDCDVCGGASDGELPECPYCGVAGVTDAGAESPTEDRGSLAPTPTAPTPTSEPRSSVDAGALDAAVARVREMQGRVAGCLWELGAEIAGIHSAELWRARHPSFEVFCKAELGCTPKHARDLIDLSANFTRDEVRAFGPSKLRVLLRLPAAERAPLLAQAREGKSTRALAGEVRKRALPRRETGRRGSGPGRSARVQLPPPSPTCRVVAPARQRVPLDRTVSGALVTWTGEVTHAGGLVEVFELVETPEGLELVVERIAARGEAAE